MAVKSAPSFRSDPEQDENSIYNQSTTQSLLMYPSNDDDPLPICAHHPSPTLGYDVLMYSDGGFSLRVCFPLRACPLVGP